jgi:hypothetical protein
MKKIIHDQIVSIQALYPPDNKDITKEVAYIVFVDSIEKMNGDNLFDKNTTYLYLLFTVLEYYEFTFITYKEGVTDFYNLIDETVVLEDFVGQSNYIPNNTEFYIFIYLILQNYNQNATAISYYLIEYFLFLLQNEYNMHYRFIEIKSYLNINTKLPDSLAPLNGSELAILKSGRLDSNPALKTKLEGYFPNTDLMKCFSFFIQILDSANQITQEVLDTKYNANNALNFEPVYKIADEYNLTLDGFAIMSNQFIDITNEIIPTISGQVVAEGIQKSSAGPSAVPSVAHSAVPSYLPSAVPSDLPSSPIIAEKPATEESIPRNPEEEVPSLDSSNIIKNVIHDVKETVEKIVPPSATPSLGGSKKSYKNKRITKRQNKKTKNNKTRKYKRKHIKKSRKH